MITEKNEIGASEQPDQKYQPFSSGLAFDSWHERNCHCCQLCDITDAPTCPGDEALTLALLDGGQINTAACDYIGTTDRRTQDNGRPDYSFCTLNPVCNHFQPRP